MTAIQSRWPSYVTIWRWHFYAGLFCMPFVLWLAVTGSIYLFRPQVEALIDAPYAHVAGGGPQRSVAEQVGAAVAAVPGSTLSRYQLPDTPEQAVQILVAAQGKEFRVYVNPQTLAVLKMVGEEDRLMRVVFRLHGELLAGNPGSYLVELAASWTIVMIITGLILWWPRGGGLGGVVYPRLGAGGRRFWRDLHGVTGFWISAMALFLLISGLPWAKSWGTYLKTVRTVAEGSAVKQDWQIGAATSKAPVPMGGNAPATSGGGHAGHGGMVMPHHVASYQPLDRVVATVRPLDLAAPVLVSPPAADGKPWKVVSDAANRPLRTSLTVDGASGRVLSRDDFDRRRLIDRLVGYGVAVHEGQLFGWLNQLLNLITALGLVLMIVGGVVMWWRRRPQGALGAPRAGVSGAAGFAVVLLIVPLALLLPLFGISLLAVLAVERLVLRRSPALGSWLGLAGHGRLNAA